MGSREEDILETGFHVFDSKMVEPQRLGSLQEFLRERQPGFASAHGLGLKHGLSRCRGLQRPAALTELLEMLSVQDRWRALRKKNANGDTVLHVAASCRDIDIVDVLLRYEEVVQPPLDDEETEDSEEKEVPLLELRNDLGETPIFAAAKEGNLKMLQHVSKRVADLQMHFRRDADKNSILHMAIMGQHFDVAVWLLIADDRLADEKDDNEFTSLQLLSKMPFVFRILPEYHCEDFDDQSKRVLTQRTGLENGEEDKYPPASGFSRINYAIWKFLAGEWLVIDSIWQTKKRHKLATCLVKLLVPKDNSWQRTTIVRQRSVVVLPIIKPSIQTQEKRLTELKEKKEKEKEKIKPAEETSDTRIKSPTPLLLAASTGIVEIVEYIIGLHPEAINHVSESELDVLQVTVMTRQVNIYRILRKCGALKRLANRISDHGRTILHQVARMKFYERRHQAGIVYELQEELHWFERVKKIIPARLVMHCNEEDLTAQDQFEMEHKYMLKNAQDWIKQTAQSCSAVAVLVATVVFAAVYQVPGGTDKRGVPKLLGSSVFWFFTINDVVALGSSLSSLVMFLSILTFPFDMWEFRKSLPRKLTWGFTMLFLSLITTLLSFTATILLTIMVESKTWSKSLLYTVAFFPVTIFGLMQFPLYMALKTMVTHLSKMLKKLVPRPLIKSTKRLKKRKYRESVEKKLQTS